MKRYVKSSTKIQAASGDVVMKSNDGLFEVVKTSGVGYKDTPWEGLEVRSLGDAEEYVVEIRLMSSYEDFTGPDKPVKYKYYGVEVAHGMRSRRESLDETARYIEVLQSALKFARKIEQSDIISKR